jgi:hypothetical protein
MKSFRFLIVLLPILGLSAFCNAQFLEKRHMIELRFGMWHHASNVRTEISPGSVSTTVGNNGYMGEVVYGHWLTESTALQVIVGGASADVSTSVGITGVSNETAQVGHILLGIKKYFPESTYGSSVRPFAKVAVGPYIGSQTEVKSGLVVAVESRSEPAFGGQIGGGVDFVLGRHFLTGISLGYNLMADFNEPIGGSKNFSGPEFSIGIGYLFGGINN